ncbi:MAG: hypothetical protein VW125_08750 [Flavobacteriaceae bacterium]|jgi:hypothetical protein
MKNKLIYILLLALFLGCQEPDNVINDIFDNIQQGAVLRTISSEGEYNFYSPNESVFKLTFEEHDIENGALMQNVEVFVSHNGGAEVLYKTYQPNEFTTGPTGLPRADLNLSLSQATSALGLTKYTGGDRITVRLKLNLTDGRSYSTEAVTGSITGSYFNSPFEYSKVIKCIPVSAIPGVYTFEMSDSYGDGWQGSHLKVTVDGVVTYYGIPSPYDSDVDRNAILEPFTGNDSSGEGKLTIPEGAKSMSFEWVSGDWPSECSYKIIYTNLDGGNQQTVFSESTPKNGKKTLSICQ